MGELGDFLLSRRAKVSPEQVGLRAGGRRRVPGLRREELAQLAGISVEYYQRLEQGRANRPSQEVLDAIARVLSLDDVERAHLVALVGPPRDDARSATPAVRPELRSMLDLMDRVAALVITDGFDVLAANPPAVRLLGDAVSGPAANLARHLFLVPSARDLYVDWADVAAATAAQLRLAVGRHPADAGLAALIADLTRDSADFRVLWATQDVELRTAGAKRLRHPELGVLALNYENFEAPGNPRQRLVTLTPDTNGSSSAAAFHLLD
ncbi:helix-turn-helix transcriptional regulator [Spirillospora sp. NPDC052269]